MMDLVGALFMNLPLQLHEYLASAFFSSEICTKCITFENTVTGFSIYLFIYFDKNIGDKNF